jgi:RNA 3'-terminal phosphate cyclase
MVRIDGFYMEGGGQILRTALALSTQKDRQIKQQYDIYKILRCIGPTQTGF